MTIKNCYDSCRMYFTLGTLAQSMADERRNCEHLYKNSHFIDEDFRLR